MFVTLYTSTYIEHYFQNSHDKYISVTDFEQKAKPLPKHRTGPVSRNTAIYDNVFPLIIFIEQLSSFADEENALSSEVAIKQRHDWST